MLFRSHVLGCRSNLCKEDFLAGDGSRIDLFEKQIEIFKPGLAVTASEENARILSGKFPEIDVMWGSEGLFAAATCDCDIVVNSLAGILGLEPTYEAVKAGNNVAFANKETLVAGGALIMDAADRAGVKILPVDSEQTGQLRLSS